MDEISVLDYLKFKLNPKNFGKEILPAENPLYAEDPSVGDASEAVPTRRSGSNPGREAGRFPESNRSQQRRRGSTDTGD